MSKATNYITGKAREIKKIIVHCSASQDAGELGVKDINLWHKLRGFSDDNGDGVFCGYHYVITRSGVIENARPEYRIGAHCEGHNSDSIGICWMGTNLITDYQKLSLLKLLDALLFRHQLGPGSVFGHYEFTDKKTCPNLNMNELREELIRYQWETKDGKTDLA